jgi:hypothetical protein
MAINLSRNTRVWFTTSVDSEGVLADTTTSVSNFTAANTCELQVLDGYTFSQGTASTPITLMEAGNTPVRGQRTFNTALNPVDISFSTYIRPTKASTLVTCAEKVLWNALTGAVAIDPTGQNVSTLTRATGTGVPSVTLTVATALASLAVGDAVNITGVTTAADWNGPAVVTALTGAGLTITATMSKAPAGTATTAAGTMKVVKGQWAESTTNAFTSFAGSNKNQLQKFAMIFLVDTAVYVIDNCALNQAVIDFGLDAIAMIAWTGFGSNVKKAANITPALLKAASFTEYSSTAPYINNKLSSTTLALNIGGGGKSYKVPLTGGSITINNNITYVTPNNLGVVNKPTNYFTGTRSITGTLNAYLKTGDTDDTGQLLSDVLTTSNTSSETEFKLQVEIGGSSNAPRVELDMPGVSLQVPTIDIADVVSTTISFTAQGSQSQLSGTNGADTEFDPTAVNDMIIRYFSV